MRCFFIKFSRPWLGIAPNTCLPKVSTYAREGEVEWYVPWHMRRPSLQGMMIGQKKICSRQLFIRDDQYCRLGPRQRKLFQCLVVLGVLLYDAAYALHQQATTMPHSHGVAQISVKHIHREGLPSFSRR